MLCTVFKHEFGFASLIRQPDSCVNPPPPPRVAYIPYARTFNAADVAFYIYISFS